ncbi:MAG: lysophospholipid acyltransferase family protein [bacterium]
MKYFAFVIAGALARVLPLKALYVLADLAGEIWYFASPRLRAVLAHNLALVPGVGFSPARRIGPLGRRISRNFGRVVAEFLYSPRITPENVGDFVDLESFEPLRRYREAPGAVFATAHLGSWEFAGTILTMLGIKLTVIVYDDPDPRVAALFRERREARGMTVIPVKATARELIAAVKEGSLAVVADRDFSGRGMETEYFGKRARMPFAYAGLAAARGMPVVFGVCVKGKDGKYRLVTGEPLLGRKDDTEGARRVAEECIRKIEKCVEKYPEQWYLFEKIGGGFNPYE